MKIAVLLLLAPLALAEEKCAIEGQVVNAATGEPIRKANHMLRPAETNRVSAARIYPAVTDAAGRFAIKEIDAGKYRLTAQRNGFVAGEYGARGPGRPGRPFR